MAPPPFYVGDKMRIVANMIGRNEVSRHLDAVLHHLSPIVDEIVFTDDASIDYTADIASQYGAKVYRNQESMFEVDEGKLRTSSWHNLENHVSPGDWVLAIDCDEKLWSAGPDVNLHTMLENTAYAVAGITFFHMWNDTQYRVDKLWTPNLSTRLFRYFPGGVYRDRKLACGAEPTYVYDLVQKGNFWRDTGLIMQHLGYTTDADKKAKYERYSTIDAGLYHNKNHIESIADEDVQLVDWKGYPLVPQVIEAQSDGL
jgi:glycosyltransferase involved in cell wall biosynthesis